MKKTFGARVTERAHGMLRPIHFTEMMRMDEWTSDGRRLQSAGGKVRELPRTVYGQWTQGQGHEGAEIIGRLDQVAFHDDGSVEGWGWLADDDNGRRAAGYLSTKVFRHNSVDLADIKAEINITEDFELEFDFLEWAVAATTLVGKPAFGNAAAELGDELKASYEPSDEPFEISLPWQPADNYTPAELTASAATTVPYDDFHIPEADEPHKIVVDAESRVYGSLCEWGKPHRSFMDRLVTCPRPRDGYRSFNHAGPLTERGQVGTGPIFLVGGHAGGRSLRGLDRDQVSQAMGGVENAWADVRVTEGRHGPWVSGRLRPGLTDEQIHAARCSHISGHWIGDELVAIASVNVPAFSPGVGFAQLDEHGDVLELVASFRPTERPAEPDLATRIADAVVARLTLPAEVTASITATGPDADGVVVLDVTEFDLALLDVELALDDD
jgi:hypothetical protein